MRVGYFLSAAVVLFLMIATSTVAVAVPLEATISLGRDPEPPLCVLNPGGVIDITWDIEHTTTPNYVYYKLEDPTRTIILEDSTYAGSSGVTINRQWTVPPGAVDGKYWVRVEYWSFEAGNEANAEVTFYVCTDTGEICAEKYQDVDRDGNCSDDATPIENWWICLTTPFGDTYCKKTGIDGSVCWTDVLIGTYTVFEPPVAGWNPVSPSTYDVEVTGPTTVEFCNATMTTKGACCGPWGSSACILAYETWCVNQGGIFMGEGTSCGGGICTTRTVPSSWGRIKAMYR